MRVQAYTVTANVTAGNNQHVDTAAERFVALRKALGLTQDDVVRDAGPQRSAISKVESGENQLTGAKLLRVAAHAVGLTMEQLLDYTQGAASLADTLPLCDRSKRPARRPPSVPPPAEWFEVDDAATREAATVFLREPSPGQPPMSQAAIDLALPRIRMSSAEAAKDPRQVANAVRLYVWGVSAGNPPKLEDTRHSSKRL